MGLFRWYDARYKSNRRLNQHVAYMNEKNDVKVDTYMTYTVIYG